MSENILNVSRRGFLKGVVSAGALVLSVRLVPEACGQRRRTRVRMPTAPCCTPTCLWESIPMALCIWCAPLGNGHQQPHYVATHSGG